MDGLGNRVVGLGVAKEAEPLCTFFILLAMSHLGL